MPGEGLSYRLGRCRLGRSGSAGLARPVRLGRSGSGIIIIMFASQTHMILNTMMAVLTRRLQRLRGHVTESASAGAARAAGILTLR